MTRWVITREISLGLLLAVGVQTAAAAWFAAGMTHQIRTNAEQITKISANLVVLDSRQVRFATTGAVLDQRLVNLNRLVTRLERITDRRAAAAR